MTRELRTQMAETLLHRHSFIMETVLPNRFPRTLANAQKALALSDLGLVLDNTDQREPYQHAETWRNGRRTVHVRTGK